jgi:hypothetical protein
MEQLPVSANISESQLSETLLNLLSSSMNLNLSLLSGVFIFPPFLPRVFYPLDGAAAGSRQYI